MKGRISSRSRLVPAGLALMITGMAFPRALSVLADGIGPGRGREAVTAATLILYAGFVVGLGLAIVGILRNRRALRD